MDSFLGLVMLLVGAGLILVLAGRAIKLPPLSCAGGMVAGCGVAIFLLPLFLIIALIAGWCGPVGVLFP